MVFPQFLIIDLYLLIPAVFTRFFNPVTELVIHIKTLTSEAKAQIKIHPVIVEAKISKRSV